MIVITLTRPVASGPFTLNAGATLLAHEAKRGGWLASVNGLTVSVPPDAAKLGGPGGPGVEPAECAGCERKTWAREGAERPLCPTCKESGR